MALPQTNASEQPQKQSAEYLSAINMMNNSIREDTRAKYQRRVNAFIRWVKTNADENIAAKFIPDESGGGDPGGSVELPVDKEIILQFFGARSMDLQQLNAVSTMEGYKSALVYWYKTKDVYQYWPEKELKEYSKGYKKTISQKKEKGEMTTFEGKRAISIETYRKLLQYSLKPELW